MADNLAKQRLNQCILDGFTPRSQRFADEGWSISWRGTKLSKLDHGRLYSLMWTGTALEYWTRKHRLDYSTTLTIDWDICGEALHSLSFSRRRRLVKQASGHLGVGKVLQRWGLQNHSECPCCQGEETPTHVIRCPDPRATTVWETTLSKLSAWMLRKQTDPAIQQAVLRHLREWHDGPSISNPSYGPFLRQAIKNQNDIGWYPFLLGHVSNHWRGVQQAYYDRLSLDNTGKQWVKQLIVQLFNISWDLWEHRNGIKHNSMTPAKLRAILVLDTRIRAEFDLGDAHLHIRDKRWFVKPLHTILDTYTTVEKGQWLASVEMSRWRWTRRRDLHRFQQDASRQLLRNWMATQPTPPNLPA